MIIRLENAAHTLQLFLDATVDIDAQNEQFEQRIAALGPEATRFLAAMMVFGDLANEEESDPNHITRDLDTMLTILENDNGQTKMFSRSALDAQIQNVESLKEQAVRDQCLHTVYRLMWGNDPDVATAMVEMFERVTEQQLYFGELSFDDAILYRKLYTLCIALYADSMSTQRLMQVCISPLLVTMLTMEVMVPAIIGNHIRKSMSFAVRESTTIDLATSLSMNDCILGQNAEGLRMLVQQWVALAATHMAETEPKERNIVEWAQQHKDVAVNDQYTQGIIQEIMLLYDALITGYYLIEYRGEQHFEQLLDQVQTAPVATPESAPSAAEAPQAVREQPSFDQRLLQLGPRAVQWISQSSSQQSILRWLESFESKEAAWALLQSTAKQLFPDLAKEGVVSAVVGLDHFFKSNGYDAQPDLIYYQEATGSFDWMNT